MKNHCQFFSSSETKIFRDYKYILTVRSCYIIFYLNCIQYNQYKMFLFATGWQNISLAGLFLHEYHMPGPVNNKLLIILIIEEHWCPGWVYELETLLYTVLISTETIFIDGCPQCGSPVIDCNKTIIM